MIIVGFLAVLVAFVVVYLVGAAIFWIVSTAITGLIVGALGRLIVPGQQKISIFATIVCGWAGALVGSAIGGLAGLHHGLATLGIEVLASAVGVAYWSTHTRHQLKAGGRSHHRIVDI